MTSHTQTTLASVLAELSQLYPDMRFGQLLEMIAVLAGDDSPDNPYDIDDGRLLQTAAAHVSNRLQQSGVQRALMPPLRTELLHLLGELQDCYPDWRFGQVAVNVAGWSDVSLYDAEDEQLLNAGRHHLVPGQV